jgi:endo-1,4-beta-mannosidase
LLPFLAGITGWLAGGTPILFEEFGLPTTLSAVPETRLLVTESAAAAYTGRVLDGLRMAGCIGALLWCFTDYVAELAKTPPFDSAPHELSFGLWRSDGTPKPAVSEVTTRAGSARIPRHSYDWLDIDYPTFNSDRRFHLARLYRRFQSCGDV